MMMFSYPQFSQAEFSKVTVNKSVVEIVEKEGEEGKFSFWVRNDGDEEQRIGLEVRNIEFDDNNTYSIVEAQDGPSSKVHFAENDFVLASKAIREVKGSISHSQEMMGSQKMLVLVSFSAAQEPKEYAGVQTQGKIGVYLLTKGDEKSDGWGKIENVFVRKFWKEKVDVQVRYRNMGDVYFVPEATVKIRNILSGEQKELDLEKHFVFPGKKFSFSQEITEFSSWGFFRVEVNFVDGNGKMDSARRYACGYLFPVVLVLIIIVLAWIIIFILRKRNQVSMELLEKRKVAN
jgi:hypothetical protein